MATRANPDANPYCSRPWKQITVLSDGTVVCACIDAAKTNPLGNVMEQSFEEIWNGPAYVDTRRKIIEDIEQIPICRSCPNRVPNPPANPEAIDSVPKPKALFLESVAACNLACPGCDRDAIEGTRTKLVLDTDVMKKVITEMSPELEYLEYHVGGENFMHKDSYEVIRHAKTVNPGVFILSSTNGHYFKTEDQRREVVESGIDCLIFSIDGTDQESYERYRVGGNFQKVIDNMRGVLEWREKLGSKTPYIVWRYILFDWNDSDEEMEKARTMAQELGVDYFCWHLNVAQDDFSSKKHYIGAERNKEIEHELWDHIQRYVPVDMQVFNY